MKTKILAIGIFVITAVVVGFYPLYNKSANAKSGAIDIANHMPKIQLAILLDTSSSMSGLINQSRNQLWQVVNEFSLTRKMASLPHSRSRSMSTAIAG